MSVLAQALAAFVPPLCCACREPVGSDEVLCGGCRRALPWLRAERCPRCALPAHLAGNRCPAAGAAFVAAWAPLAYAGSARSLVAAVKYQGATAAIDAMAATIAAGAPAGLLDGAALVPVPAHPARRRARGFDQAVLLARAVARRTGRPVWEGLRRGVRAPPQHAATRDERLTARLAIAARRHPPPVAALIDDVHTTGATFDACARALRVAGSEEVTAIAYTRTL